MDARPIQAEIRELEHKQERLLESLYAGAAPALVNERLTQVQSQLEAALGRLAAVSPTSPMVDPRTVQEALEGLLGREDLDLGAARGFVEVISLPATNGAPPVLRAFGVEFRLVLNVQRRRRGAGKVLAEQSVRMRSGSPRGPRKERPL